MNHNATCQKWQDKMVAQLAAYDAAWPHACQKCNGTGGLSTCDWVPYGSGNVPMYGSEPCEACFGKCPRCGVEVPDSSREEFFDQGGPCTGCGWDFSTPARPVWDGECGCEYSS